MATFQKHHHVIPAIMIGGSGTRLWPLSRANKPKQFLALDGGNPSSFFQRTLHRFSGPLYGLPWLMTAHETLVHAKEQVRQLDFTIGGLMVEPSMQGTAAAIAALTVAISEMDPAGLDAVLLVAPSDHLIRSPNLFNGQVARGVELAHCQDRIVTFGITPDYPETGFGYIRPGEPLLSDGQINGHSIRQGDFLEKPTLENAKRYLEEGYCWNAGIFMFRAGVMLDELAKYAPYTLLAAQNAVRQARVTNTDVYPSVWLHEESFRNAPADLPIDTAVMENTEHGAVVPCTGIGWSDIGSLSALYDVADHKDNDGNALTGPVIALESKNTLAYARGNRKVILIGLENMIVVDDEDAILIARMDKAQKVKDAVNHLKQTHQPETRATRAQLYDWGQVRLINSQGQTVVYNLTLRPGSSLCVQPPASCWENWVITSGEVLILRNGVARNIGQSDSLSPDRDQILSVHNHSVCDAAIMIVRHYDATGIGQVTADTLLQIVAYDESRGTIGLVSRPLAMAGEDDNHPTN